MSAREKLEKSLRNAEREGMPMEFKGPRLVARDGSLIWNCGNIYITVDPEDPNWSEEFNGGIWLNRGRRIE